MFALPDPFVALQRQSLESAKAIAMATFAGMEKLAQLNVQAARASVEESVQRSLSLLESQDAKGLGESLTDTVRPSGEKLTAYAKHVYDIASETREEIARVVERQFSEGNRQLTASIEAMARNSPVGSEGVVTMVKTAMTAADATWDQVNKAGQQVAEATDANVTNVTNEVLTAGATAAARQPRH